MGHARITITLDAYTHLFDDGRHGREIRQRMTASPFAGLLRASTENRGAPSTSASTRCRWLIT